MLELNQVYNMDCLDGMKMISNESIDLILTDLPYGTTKCSWDIRIPFDPLWKEYKRIIKPNGAILLFSSQPFTTDLINSNRKMFRYEIVWEKTMKSGFLNAKKMPLRSHENICIFYKKLPTYNPQKTKISCQSIGRIRRNSKSPAQQYQKYTNDNWEYIETGERYPVDVIRFSNWNGALFGNTQNATQHHTQKPVSLLEYLIYTYTNPNEIVFDSCIGSGSTAIAAINTKRKFLGFEKDASIFKVCQKRLFNYFQKSENDL